MLVGTGAGGACQILRESARLGPAGHGETGRVHLGGDPAAEEGRDGVDVGSRGAVP